MILRPELGSRSLQQVELAMSSIVEASEYGGTDADIFKHRDIADNMLASGEVWRIPPSNRL